MAGSEKTVHPIAPKVVKPLSPKDGQEAIPIDRVEGLFEVNFEHKGWGFAQVAESDDVSRIDDVF
jgi:hypothetical protein